MGRLLNSNGLYTFKNVKRWSRKLSIFLLDKVFIPINVGNSHWVLLVAYIKLKKIKYYDSMGRDGKVYVDAVMRWLQDIALHQYKFYIDVDHWSLDVEDHCPRQLNGYDCGVFTIVCVDHLAAGLDLNYSQSQMLAYRIKIGNDLIKGFIN